VWYDTFAISAQLLPASLIVLSRASSAAVHGVFVLDFFAGGCMAGESCSAVAGAEVEGPADAIVVGVEACCGGALLFVGDLTVRDSDALVAWGACCGCWCCCGC
jgi:hypothetical protein